MSVSHSRGRRLDLALAVGLGAVLVSFAIHKISSHDLWWQIAAGRWILDHGWPTVDPYSFAFPDRPWIELRWLFCVAVAGVFDHFGANALFLAKTGLLLGTLGL